MESKPMDTGIRQISVMRKLLIFFSALLLISAPATKAQKNAPRGMKGTVVHPANLYVQADESANRVSTVMPGRELVIAEHSGKWLRVFANTDVETVNEADAPIFGNETNAQPISGWMIDKGVVTADTPNGGQILFGEAVSMENLASESHPPPDAAQSARRLYRMVVDLFPQSPRAAEAMWRAADIRWQLQKADAFSRPSAHEKESYLREQMDENEMKKIQKLYPHTRWADLAAYDMIDNKICGDWQGSEKCPEKEAELYTKYADEHPDSPKAAQALYQAAWREASAGDMYQSDNDDKKAGDARGRAKELAGRLQTKYPDSDYAARAAGLIYKMEQQIPIYGNDRE
jgi:outer membrane protein assembly factor BamD (BamD/ComL family)